RVFQEGNVIAVRALVHNHTGADREVSVSLRAPFPLASGGKARLRVAAGAIETAELPVTVDRYLESAELALDVRSVDGEHSDSLVLRVPGRRSGAPFQDGRSGAVASGETREEVFRLPSNAIRGSLALEVDLDGGLHSAIVESLEPLVEYPYGCVEQTMSRFLPAVAVDRALGRSTHRFREKLPRVIASGLERLSLQQHADGGWGWWPDDATNLSMTAYVLHGLSSCKRAGVAVDRAIARRAADLLRQRLGELVFRDAPGETRRVPLPSAPDTRAYAALALAEHDSAWRPNGPASDEGASLATRRLVATLASASEPLRAIDEALLSLACLRAGLAEDGERLAKAAGKRPLEDVATAALLLEIEVARGGDPSAAARFLLSRRTGKGWRTTIESAHAILGLAALLEREGGVDYSPGTVVVTVNGRAAREVALPDHADASFDGRVRIAEPEQGWGERAILGLRFVGKGTALFTASLSGFERGAASPVARGLEVRRTFLEQDGSDWRVVERTVRPGSRVLVHLEVTAPSPREYVLVSDPRASGFEPLGDERLLLSRARVPGARQALSERVELPARWEARLADYRKNVRGDAALESRWALSLLEEIFEKRSFKPAAEDAWLPLPQATRPTSIEHRDDRTLFFLSALPQGTTHLYYVTRAELAGEVRALAPQAAPMYEPELRASGVDAPLLVTKESSAGEAPAMPLAPGVAGLRRLLSALGPFDAEALVRELPSAPRIGHLLVSLGSEPGLRAWLACQDETAAARGEVAGRIEAARRDLATRSLCVVPLVEGATPERLSMIEDAARDDRLARLVLDGATAADATKLDRVLLWVLEDRAQRNALRGTALRLRGTARLDEDPVPPLTVSRVLAALGPSAPSGEALLSWKLAQRLPLTTATLGELVSVAERDLGIEVKCGRVDLSLAGDFPCDAPLSLALDRVLVSHEIFYRVRGGVLAVGTIDELAR
ncbi:hypothetical protein HY251_07215, partial [bacterium]|nr:hypothetical protein [bacterium]